MSSGGTHGARRFGRCAIASVYMWLCCRRKPLIMRKTNSFSIRVFSFLGVMSLVGREVKASVLAQAYPEMTKKISSAASMPKLSFQCTECPAGQGANQNISGDRR